MDSEHCKALVFRAVDCIEYTDIPMPRIESAGDAVLKVLVCGVCGSDLHPFHGKEVWTSVIDFNLLLLLRLLTYHVIYRNCNHLGVCIRHCFRS